MSTLPNDPAQLLASLMKGGTARPGGAAPGGPAQGTPGADPMAGFVAFTHQMAQIQQQFMKDMTDFWSGKGLAGAFMPGTFAADAKLEAGVKGEASAGKSAATAASDDKRFASEAWRSDPRFDLLRRTYLAYSDFLRGAVETVPLDDKTKAQVRFGMQQFVDAMSPSNFFATNPEAMQLAVETSGQSVLQGMNLFFEDLAKGRVSSTDEKAYEVGKNIATTPGAVIFQNEIMEVIQYAPLTQEVFERPLVMIPPCINKYYILDLQPENSLVRHGLAQGHRVFMVSWRNAGPEQGELTWDDYLQEGVMRAIDVALAVSGADKVNTLGFCIGGTLLASAIAVMRARDEDKVASLTLLTSMLDFSDTGEIGNLVTEQSVAARETAIGHGGLMKGKELAFTFSSLRANDLMWQYVVNSYLKGKAPPAFDMLYWNADSTNLPGPMFCWYVPTPISRTICAFRARRSSAGSRSTCRSSTSRRSSTHRARITSCRGGPLMPRPSCWAGTRPSSWARADTSQASSIRRPRRNAATGSTAPRVPMPIDGSSRRRKCREAGGRCGRAGWTSRPARRFRPRRRSAIASTSASLRRRGHT